MTWSPAARQAAQAARKQKSPGGFTSQPQHQPAVTGMGNAAHGVSQPHQQAPKVLPPVGYVRQTPNVTAAKAMRPGGPNIRLRKAQSYKRKMTKKFGVIGGHNPQPGEGHRFM
ncbi:MAG: hypothetical protein JOY77_09020 [Alphaproteobacteria bacterium]|nr:hypothetical protein [Alphaproteobacteria bacterium]